MSNIHVIEGEFILVYREKLCREDKKCFFNKIGAIFVKDIGVKNELEMDLITLSKSNELWTGFDLELDAERIATHIELLSGYQMSCMPNRLLTVALEGSCPIFQRGIQVNRTTSLCNVTFPGFPSIPPNDPLYPGQWGIVNTQVNDVWGKYGVLGTDVIIGVFDTGADPTHPDLKTTFVQGYNFITIPMTRNTQDTHGHGTSMAGIIAATTNNGKGIAAVAPGSKVMPFKVINDDGRIVTSIWIEALSFVITESDKNDRNLVDIINMSLGTDDLKQPEKEVLTSLINIIINRLEIPVVASAGNETDAFELFPAELPNVISVAAITPQNDKSKFSNSGTWVKVAAPGTAIFTTTLENAYRAVSGTSPATAIVSGIISLILEYINNIGIIVGNKAVFLSGILYGSAIQDDQTGVFWEYGRVNALEAMNLIPRPILEEGSGAKTSGKLQ